MLPECKIRSRRASNKSGQLLVTNIQTSDPYRPNAVNDYINKKNQRIKDIHAEITRVTMGYTTDII